MVAIIKSSASAKRCCQYNETKVKTRLAICIMGGNYPCEASDLTARQRMLLLQKRLDLNERVKKGCLHIVLSFSAQDKLSQDQLKKISQSYIDQIGLADQPFLVYQHLDTLHPHLHLVAVTVKADGSGNSVFHARQAAVKNVIQQIEKDYHLTPSQGRRITVGTLDGAQKLQHGKIPAALAISQVLSVVLPHFKYGSLTELNAVLRHYNLVAKTGKPGSKTHLHNGLCYQMLADDGRRTGASVKASRLPGKPTMRYLNERFEVNRIALLSEQQRIKTLVDLALLAADTRSVAGMGEHLSRQAVRTVYVTGATGQLCDIIFVDFRARSAFSASQLGGRYTASNLLAHFDQLEKSLQHPAGIYPSPLPKPPGTITDIQAEQVTADRAQVSAAAADESLLKLLLDPVPVADYLPQELKRRLQKKRKQISLQL